MMADLWGDGRLRARFNPGEIEDVRSFRGILAVIKFLGATELYRGVAEVLDEPIGGALQRYFQTSVQIESRIRIQADAAILAIAEPDGQGEL